MLIAERFRQFRKALGFLKSRNMVAEVSTGGLRYVSREYRKAALQSVAAGDTLVCGALVAHDANGHAVPARLPAARQVLGGDGIVSDEGFSHRLLIAGTPRVLVGKPLPACADVRAYVWQRRCTACQLMVSRRQRPLRPRHRWNLMPRFRQLLPHRSLMTGCSSRAR